MAARENPRYRIVLGTIQPLAAPCEDGYGEEFLTGTATSPLRVRHEFHCWEQASFCLHIGFCSGAFLQGAFRVLHLSAAALIEPPADRIGVLRRGRGLRTSAAAGLL